MPTTGSSNVYTQEVQTSTIGDTIPTPPVGSLALFSNTNGNWYAKNSSGVVTVLGGVSQIVAGTAISVSPAGGTGVVTVNNTGVTSNVAGTGISVSGATGAVTITNTGVTSIVAGTAISISGGTGAVTINNTGVTSAVAGSGISVSGATGAVTFSNTGVLSVTSASSPSSTKGSVVVTTASGVVTIANPINWAGVLYVDAANTQGWTGADAGAQINNAYAYGNTLWGNGANSGGFIIELASAVYTVSTPMVLANATNLTCCWLRGKGDGNGGTILNYTNATATVCLSIAGGSGNDGGIQISDFTITGTAIANTATAVQWGTTAAQTGTAVNVAGATAKNISIRRFTNGFTQSASTSYGIEYLNCKVQQCTNGHTPLGENIVMFGGLIGSCTNAIVASSACEVQMFGVAFDDNTTQGINITNASARITDCGCRYENPTIANPTLYVNMTAGSFSKFGGGFQDDNTTGAAANGFIAASGGTVAVRNTWIFSGGRTYAEVINASGTAQVIAAEFIMSQNSTITEFPTIMASQGFLSRGAIGYLTAPVTSSAVASTETLALAARIPGNSVRVGDTFRVTAGFSNVSTGTVALKLRVGAAGTVAGDAVALTLVTSAAQVANTWVWFDALVTVRSATTVMANGVGTATAVVLPMATAAPATATIASTAPWFIDITMADSVASGLICETASVTLI